MCQKPFIKPSPQQNDELILLLTSGSFLQTVKDKKTPTKPSKKSVCLTIAVLVTFLVLSELLHRYAIGLFLMDYHPLFAVEKHRNVLARHIGVDSFACLIISFIAYINRHLLHDVWTFKRSSDPQKAYDRIHTYHPEAHRVLMFFIAYLVKGTYDAMHWDTTGVMTTHHIVSMAVAWFGMYPGVAQMYGIFFMGISEFSTCVLCLLANFNPEKGIVGLDELLPNTKIVLGVLFAVTFLFFRVYLWMLFTYHFLLDSLIVLRRNTAKETRTLKSALRMMVFSCVALTFLQVFWLSKIFAGIKKELF